MNPYGWVLDGRMAIAIWKGLQLRNFDELLQYSLLVSQGGLAKSEDELRPQGEKI